MPERIYMNRIVGEERIHIEIPAHEIADILDDFAPSPDAFAATKRLHGVLAKAARDLNLTCQVTDTGPATGPTWASDGPAAPPVGTETSEAVSGPHTGAQDREPLNDRERWLTAYSGSMPGADGYPEEATPPQPGAERRERFQESIHATSVCEVGDPVRCGGGCWDAADAAMAVDEERRELRDQRDGAYRERAQLLAWLATIAPAVLAPAPDVDEDGWCLLFLYTPQGQLSWHISPNDTGLFEHAQRVQPDDPRAWWDGHTTEEKYQRIRTMVGSPTAEGGGR